MSRTVKALLLLLLAQTEVVQSLRNLHVAVRERMKRLKNQAKKSHKQPEEIDAEPRTLVELLDIYEYGDVVDENEDGMLSLEELSHVDDDDEPFLEALRELFQIADKDGNGLLKPKEVETLFNMLKRGQDSVRDKRGRDK